MYASWLRWKKDVMVLSVAHPQPLSESVVLTEWLPGVRLKHSVPPVQSIYRIAGADHCKWL